jgi:transposase InsO family protein
MAAFVIEGGLCSGRAACRYLGLARATYRYRARSPTAQRSRLVERIHALSAQHPRFGFRRIAALLRREGWQVSRKQIQRLRRAEGLRVPPPRKRQVRRGVSTGLPTRATHRGQVWTWDFIADATVHGGALRMLTVLDEHTKEVHVLRPERRIGSADVIALVQAAIARHGAPEFIRSDNGPEFIAKELQRWLAEQNIKTIYITPASPWENGFVEAFHSRFRDECLNREQLWTLSEARVVIEDFRIDYNTERPHSSLGYDSPQRFAAKNTLPIPGSGPDRQTGPARSLGLPTTPERTTSTNVSD